MHKIRKTKPTTVDRVATAAIVVIATSIYVPHVNGTTFTAAKKATIVQLRITPKYGNFCFANSGGKFNRGREFLICHLTSFLSTLKESMNPKAASTPNKKNQAPKDFSNAEWAIEIKGFGVNTTRKSKVHTNIKTSDSALTAFPSFTFTRVKKNISKNGITTGTRTISIADINEPIWPGSEIA
jgi:hypothetical protein